MYLCINGQHEYSAMLYMYVIHDSACTSCHEFLWTLHEVFIQCSYDLQVMIIQHLVSLQEGAHSWK